MPKLWLSAIFQAVCIPVLTDWSSSASLLQLNVTMTSFTVCRIRWAESGVVLAGHFGCVYRGLLTSAEQKSHSLVAVKTLRHVDGNRTFTNAFQLPILCMMSLYGILQKFWTLFTITTCSGSSSYFHWRDWLTCGAPLTACLFIHAVLGDCVDK